MKTLFENEMDFRQVSERDLVYNLAQMDTDQSLTFEELIDKLTPARKKVALAAVELYKRKKLTPSAEVVRCSDDLFSIFRPKMIGMNTEEIWCTFLNQAAKVLKVQRISKGGISSCVADVRVVLKEALLCGASAFAISHNHPSGNIRPSAEDDRLTQSLKKAADTMNIRLVDHIIVTAEEYYSYADDGRI